MTMMPIYTLGTDRRMIQTLCSRNQAELDEIRDQVRSVLFTIKSRGNQAIVEYLARHDGRIMAPDEFRIPPEALKAAVRDLTEHDHRSLTLRGENIRSFHENQRLKPWAVVRDGVLAGEIVNPLESAGIYVPGGTANFPTVMQILALPAAMAGVPRIVACVPPRGATQLVLAAAELAGVHEVYQIGGIAAIGAMAYGTETIRPVSSIAGPGNILVTAAKLEVHGKVRIDMPAGPSEAVIVADESANPLWVALDVIARAEHDVMSAAIVATTSPSLANAVRQHLLEKAETFPRASIIAQSLSRNSAIVIGQSLEELLDFSNEYAPEHLQLMVASPLDLLDKVRNAGSVFVGHNCPVAVGDYLGVSNHVLPSCGYARAFSPVSVRDFQKATQFEMLTDKRLRWAYENIMKPLVVAEQFHGHQASLEARI